MKSINEIILSLLIKYKIFLRLLFFWGGALIVFGYTARVGYFYGLESEYSPLEALFAAGGLALLAAIMFLCIYFSGTPEVVSKAGVAFLCLCVGGSVAGAGVGGQWDMPVKIAGLTLGVLVAISPFFIGARGQKVR